MLQHPEQKMDEVFLGNFTPHDFAAVSWKTKRTGGFAYCQDGRLYPEQKRHGVKPAFASRAEIEQFIEQEIAAGDIIGMAARLRKFLDNNGHG